jgi:hypothetical protein
VRASTSVASLASDADLDERAAIEPGANDVDGRASTRPGVHAVTRGPATEVGDLGIDRLGEQWIAGHLDLAATLGGQE